MGRTRDVSKILTANTSLLSLASASATYATQSLINSGSSSASFTRLKFPATASLSTDANTLDDYEENSFTPNVYHETSNNSTWSTKNGFYQKIGTTVTCWVYCDGGNSGTANGSALLISGLPFPAKNGPHHAVGSFIVNGGSSTSPSGIQILSGSSIATCRVVSGAYTSQVTYFNAILHYRVEE